jgi:Ni,Fe-hydrogenase III large subunit
MSEQAISSLHTFLAAPPGNGADGRLVEGHRPWPRFMLDAAGWGALTERLAAADWSLLGIWGERDCVHMALHDEGAAEIAVATLPCPAGRFPAIGDVRPGAIRLERAIFDLFGHLPIGSVDGRPWLDHGNWTVVHPLSAQPGVRPATPGAYGGSAYRFLAATSDELHQIAVGPVHAGIIEPGHFRFHANGETVARLEARFGYVHKGTEALMAGRSVGDAARLAARISGDSTVAHSLAFAHAVEAALGIAAPRRAEFLRAVMAELERLANHFGDIGAICNDASFSFMHAHCSVLRERVLRAAQDCFGHRLMMDRVVPGGVANDLSGDGIAALRKLGSELERRFSELVRIYRGRPSLLDRTVGTGIVTPELARRFAAGGFIGRASGRGLDARRNPGYLPYDELEFVVPVLLEGDVHSRVLIRIDEVRASLDLLNQLLDELPAGETTTTLPAAAGEGMAIVESFRGDIMNWVRLAPDGTVARCFPRDPSWFQWPLIEAAIEGNIVADFPLCNKSFNCSYSGHDL